MTGGYAHEYTRNITYIHKNLYDHLFDVERCTIPLYAFLKRDNNIPYLSRDAKADDILLEYALKSMTQRVAF